MATNVYDADGNVIDVVGDIPTVQSYWRDDPVTGQPVYAGNIDYSKTPGSPLYAGGQTGGQQGSPISYVPPEIATNPLTPGPTVDELYRRTAPTTTTPQINAALVNPYTRAILEQGAQTGTLPPIDFEAETAKRIEALKNTVVPETQALLMRGLEESQRLYQKSGKLGSSAAIYGPGGINRTSEAYALQAGAQLSEGIGNIYSQIGQERASERGQIYGLYGEEMGATISAEAQKEIANIQSATDRAIAQVQADTTMSGYDKQIEIAKIQRQSAIDVANITGQYGIEQIETRGKIEVDLQGREFAFNTDPTTGKPAWLLTYDLTKLSTINPETNVPWTAEQFQASLAEQVRQFDVSNTVQREQFQATLDWAKEEFGLTQAQELKLHRAVLDEQIRQFDISSARDFDLSLRQINESARQFDLSREDQRWYNQETLRLAARQLDDAQAQFSAQLAFDILDNDGIAAYLDAKGDENAYADAIGLIFGMAFDMTPDEIEEYFNKQSKMLFTGPGTGDGVIINGVRHRDLYGYQIRDESGKWWIVDKDTYNKYKEAGNL